MSTSGARWIDLVHTPAGPMAIAPSDRLLIDVESAMGTISSTTCETTSARSCAISSTPPVFDTHPGVSSDGMADASAPFAELLRDALRSSGAWLRIARGLYRFDTSIDVSGGRPENAEKIVDGTIVANGMFDVGVAVGCMIMRAADCRPSFHLHFARGMYLFEYGLDAWIPPVGRCHATVTQGTRFSPDERIELVEQVDAARNGVWVTSSLGEEAIAGAERGWGRR